MTDSLTQSRFKVSITSTADPKGGVLLALRGLLSVNEDMRAIALQYQREGLSVEWFRDMLAACAAPLISDDYTFQDVLTACHFLADEYAQLGEGSYLVSTETGRVQLVVTPDDLYDPGVLPREGGSEAQALLRLDPKLSAALTLYHHEKARDEDAMNVLVSRLPKTTELAVGHTPSALQVATRKGRAEIAREVSGCNTREALKGSSGLCGRVLQHFDLVGDPPSEGVLGEASWVSDHLVVDAKSLNLEYDYLRAFRRGAPQGWVRSILRDLSGGLKPRELQADEVRHETFEGPDLWVGDPDAIKLLMRLGVPNTFPVEGMPLMSLSGKIGTLWVPSEFESGSIESAGTWSVTAKVPYQLRVDRPDGLCAFTLAGLARAGEILA